LACFGPNILTFVKGFEANAKNHQKMAKTRKKPQKSGKMTYLDKIWSSDLKKSFFRTFWGVAKKSHFLATF
jgi:hypothetical protein